MTSIQYHGALNNGHYPLTQETPFVNEFEALDAVDPNDITSVDNHDESGGENHEESDNDEVFMDVNFESTTEVAPTEDAPAEDAINGIILHRKKEYSQIHT